MAVDVSCSGGGGCDVNYYTQMAVSVHSRTIHTAHVCATIYCKTTHYLFHLHTVLNIPMNTFRTIITVAVEEAI